MIKLERVDLIILSIIQNKIFSINSINGMIKKDYKQELELKQKEILDKVKFEPSIDQLQISLFELKVIQKYYNKKIKANV